MLCTEPRLFAAAAIGFNVETVTYNNIKFQVWDLGGQTSIRPYWRCYYPNTQARRGSCCCELAYHALCHQAGHYRAMLHPTKGCSSVGYIMLP